MSLFDDASLVLTPNGYKASKLYSIKPTSGAGDMTVTRATTATRVNSSNLIESVAINVPRLDYTLGSCPSILVEPARTNLVLRSEEFSNGSWAKTATTVTANTTTSPDGTTTADTVTGIGAISARLIQSNSISFTTGTSYSLSVFAKKGTNDFIQLFVPLAIGGMFANFNINTGVVGTLGTVTGTTPTSSILNYGNGWYRCTINFTATATTSTVTSIGIVTSASAARSESNTLTTSIILWGGQVEVGSNASSYIPTVAGTVSRNADVINKTGVSSLIGQTQGTLYAEINISTFNSGVFFSINDGTSANRIQMYKFTDNKIYCDRIAATQSAATSIGSSALSVGTYKVAFAYESGTSYLYINGAQAGATSAATFTFGSMGKVNIGSRFDDTSTFNDRVQLAALFPTRLTTQQCIDLTTP